MEADTWPSVLLMCTFATFPGDGELFRDIAHDLYLLEN